MNEGVRILQTQQLPLSMKRKYQKISKCVGIKRTNIIFFRYKEKIIAT